MAAAWFKQRDLVDVLDLAGIEHDLLAVDDPHARVLEREQHRGLGHVHADRRVRAAGLAQERHDLLGMRLHEAEARRDGAAHAEHAGPAVGRVEPVAIEPVVHRRRAEVPDDRLAAVGEQREAAELVALPLADLGAGDVADVVDVEQEQRAAFRVPQRLARPRQAVALQPAEIDPRLEIDPHPPRRRQLTVPVPTGIQIPGARLARSWCHVPSPSGGPRVDRPDADAEDEDGSVDAVKGAGAHHAALSGPGASRAATARQRPAWSAPPGHGGRSSRRLSRRACASSDDPSGRRTARRPCPAQPSFARRPYGDAMDDAGRTRRKRWEPDMMAAAATGGGP